MSKNVLISKAQAVQIVGSEDRLLEEVRSKRLSPTPVTGEMWMLFTGAKLYQTYRGAVVRYGIYGYHHDGRDVDEVLEALAAGDRCLIICEKRIPGTSAPTSA